MFATERFIAEKLESPDAILGMFNEAEVAAPARDTVRKWFERGSIPSDWWPVVLSVLEINLGAPVSLRAYTGERVRIDDIFG